jgi:hypothetical protein
VAAQPAAVSIGSFQKAPEKAGGKSGKEENAEKAPVSVNLNKPVPPRPPLDRTRTQLPTDTPTSSAFLPAYTYFPEQKLTHEMHALS